MKIGSSLPYLGGISHDSRRWTSVDAGSLSRSNKPVETVGEYWLRRNKNRMLNVSKPNIELPWKRLEATNVAASNHARHGTSSDATLLARSQGGVTCRASYRCIGRSKRSRGTYRSHAGLSSNPGDGGWIAPFQHSLACRVRAGYCGVEAKGNSCTLASSDIV
jgi:hypothetical protein